MSTLSAVETAGGFQDLFGASPSLETVAARYRVLAKQVHPDVHPTERRRAHDAFVKLNRLRADAEASIRKEPIETIIATRKRAYRVGEVLWTGDICDLHRCRFDDDKGVHALLKIAQSEADDDLVEREAKMLRKLASTHAERFLRYFPRLIDSFRARLDGSPRQVSVIESASEHFSLEEVKRAYPKGLDYRDVVWMWKRTLVALGFAHRQGLVHGAVLPSHVLIHPINHGAKLIDWCYAAEPGEHVRARVKRFDDLYAPEIAKKEKATAATDIFMASKTIETLLDLNTPEPIRRFLSTCVAPSPRRRPDDAWALHDELDLLLRKLCGKPSYRKLTMHKENSHGW